MATASGYLKRVYLSFRTSPVFLIVLTAYVGIALALHYTLGVDKEFGLLNLTLSIESGITTSLLVLDIAQQDAARKKREEYEARQQKYMLHMLEALLARDDDDEPHGTQ